MRAASDPAHAALKWVSLQETLVFIARKLAAAIRVKDHGASRLAFAEKPCTLLGPGFFRSLLALCARNLASVQ